MKKVRKAVFPVAGLGTRFLPATKAIPKEMLPIVDRPLIQYAVDEAIEAGIEQMIFVTGRGKSAIEDHFDIAYELERTMADRGKSLAVLEATRLGPGACAYVRQQEPLGLGHAIWCARDIVGDEPFRARNYRNLRLNGGGACGNFVAQPLHRLMAGADKGDVAVLADLGEVSVLGQETIAGMNGLCSTHFGRTDDRGHAEVAVA